MRCIPIPLMGRWASCWMRRKTGSHYGPFSASKIEHLMNLGERSLVPVLTYLFRRIEKRLDGSPSLILLDEAWLMLGHPVFRAKIREWLKVLRKANCAVVLATQSISDAERSGIVDVLKESCPTKICLPNGTAREPAHGNSMSGSASTNARSSSCRALSRNANTTWRHQMAGGCLTCRSVQSR